jgi:hypothetical protein
MAEKVEIRMLTNKTVDGKTVRSIAIEQGKAVVVLTEKQASSLLVVLKVHGIK